MWRALILFTAINSVSSQCPSQFINKCDYEQNLDLFPNKFFIFQSYEGQTYTVGNVIMLVAKFSNNTCNLPSPEEISPQCTPQLTLGLFTDNGTCYNVSTESNKKLEFDFGFSFSDDPCLETDNGIYNHWTFPLHVTRGMSVSRLEIRSLEIPESCDSYRGSFDRFRLFPRGSLHPFVKIDAQPPNIVSVHTAKTPGVYTVGSIISLVVEFSKDMAISDLPNQYSDTYQTFNSPIPYGVPYIELNSNALVPLRGYARAQSKKLLTFLYIVGTGEETPPGVQLDIVAGTSIDLNGGTIVAEGSGLDMNFTSMPLPGQEGSPPPSQTHSHPPHVLAALSNFASPQNLADVVQFAALSSEMNFVAPDSAVPAGSLSFPTANKIHITRTGEKFPPLKYDPAAAPGDAAAAAVEADARRRGAGTGADAAGPRKKSSRGTKVSAPGLVIRFE